MSFIGASERR